MKKIHQSEWADLIFIMALLLGTFIRFNPTLLAGFPINDGGLFAVMVDDLRASHYRLPEFTTYNHLNIPYAYPPLGFYLGGILADLFGWNAIQVVRWLPAFFASLSIPALYLLARRLFKDKYFAAVSTLFFALMPRELSWFVMGAGLTRAPAQFFMLLAFASLIRLNEKNSHSDVVLTGLFGGLAVLGHPEAAVHTVVSAIFLWLMLSRKWTAVIHAIAAGLIALVVTMPWWETVIHYHGIGPLINAAQTGQKIQAVFHLLFFVFTEEPYATIIAVLGLIGIGQRLLRRDYLLPLWLVIPFLVEGRSASVPAAVPLAMLAAIGLIDVVLTTLQGSAAKAHVAVDRNERNDVEGSESVSRVESNVLLYVMLYLLFSTYQSGVQLSNVIVYPPDRVAMNWVKGNIPADSRFLVLTGTTSVSCDPLLEWFPALTERHSINTVQGREWIDGKDFSAFVISSYDVQRCLSSGDVSCLDAAVSRSQYDYVYISGVLRTNACGSPDFPRTFPYFLESMNADTGFDLIYDIDDVVIYKNAAPN